MPTGLRLLSRGSWPEAKRLAEILRQRDRRRGAVADRRRGGTGVGEFAVVARLSRRVGVRDRPRVAAPEPDRRGVGRRRAAGDLLLRGGTRAQTRVRRRRPARPRACRAADRRGRRRDDRARRHLRRHQPRWRATPRTSTAGRCRSPPTSRSRWPCWPCCRPICRPRCGRSCSRSPWSTTCWRSPSSPSSTPTISRPVRCFSP